MYKCSLHEVLRRVSESVQMQGCSGSDCVEVPVRLWYCVSAAAQPYKWVSGVVKGDLCSESVLRWSQNA